DHLFALLEMAKENGLEKVYVHAFLDGRDVGPQTALPYIEETERKLADLGVGQIATVSGRYYAMDRDKRWERVKLAYDAITHGRGHTAISAKEAVENSYEVPLYDEFMLPTVITTDGETPIATVENGYSIVFYNFRPDRAIQLSKSFANESFTYFDRGDKTLDDLFFVQMTPYSESVSGSVIFDS